MNSTSEKVPRREDKPGGMNRQSWRILALMWVPGIMAGLPIPPPAKMMMSAGLCFLFSLFLAGMAIHDAIRPVRNRPSVPLGWIVLSVAFGLFSMASWKIAPSFSMPKGHQWDDSIGGLLFGGIFVMLAGMAIMSAVARNQATTSPSN